jgi:hypothetical protein
MLMCETCEGRGKVVDASGNLPGGKQAGPFIDYVECPVCNGMGIEPDRVEAIVDGHHRGTEIYWSSWLQQWVVVDLENDKIGKYDRLVIYHSNRCGDETGLNHVCVACDLDATPGMWVVDAELGEDAAAELPDGVRLAWDSADCGLNRGIVGALTILTGDPNDDA